MSGVYSVEDLLKLRASPLICKPANLPPIEEWMGTQEPVKRPNTRGRQEEGSSHPEAFQKRPTLDPSQRKSTTDPERLVLGPPRRSFASSSGRPLGRSGTEGEEVQRERAAHHERNKTGDDLDARFSNARAVGANGRLGQRQEQDGTSQRRRLDEEDGDTKPRRDHDRPRWGTREARDDKAGDENSYEPGNTKSATARRDQGRSKFEQPWLRGEKGIDDSRRENDRGSGYRRDRVRDGDWDMPSRNDIDPEWMESIEAAEPAQAHTQEDFQRWKERMKAGSGATDTRAEAVTEVSVTSDEAKPISSTPLSSIISPDISANSMDKWFARLSEKKPSDDKNTITKPATKTRFASLFGPPVQLDSKPEQISPLPPTPPAPQVAAPSPVPVEPSIIQPMNDVDAADQAGFQRILQMLGKRESTTTQAAGAQKPKTPLLPGSQQTHQRKDSPDLMSLFRKDLPIRQPPVSQNQVPPGFEPLVVPQNQVPPGFESLVDSRSSGDGPARHINTPNKDELLLNLLRQAENTAKPRPQNQQQYNEQRAPPGLQGMFDTTRNGSRPQMQELDRSQREPGRSIFDDLAISGLPYQDDMRTREGVQRRPTNMSNAFDDPYAESLRSERQQPQPPKPTSIQPPGPPIQRPPGLDQASRMPPGWDQRQPPQNRQGPPPGLARGPPPGYGGGHQPPLPQMPQQLPGQVPQRTPQRKYTAESTMPNFPPGMGPPPGFMSGGPPPGFHHSSAAGVAQNFGRYGMGGNDQPPLPQQQQQQPPMNMNRGFLDMYRVDERSGLRGGNGGVPLPPGFR